VGGIEKKKGKKSIKGGLRNARTAPTERNCGALKQADQKGEFPKKRKGKSKKGLGEKVKQSRMNCRRPCLLGGKGGGRWHENQARKGGVFKERKEDRPLKAGTSWP